MDIWTLSLFLGDIAPSVQVIEGRVFLDRDGVGSEILEKKISEYSDIERAQEWINSVPVDDFFSEVVDDWDILSPQLEEIAKVYERSWRAICSAAGVGDVAVAVLRDPETGDVIFRLIQPAANG